MYFFFEGYTHGNTQNISMIVLKGNVSCHWDIIIPFPFTNIFVTFLAIFVCYEYISYLNNSVCRLNYDNQNKKCIFSQVCIIFSWRRVWEKMNVLSYLKSKFLPKS